MWQVVSYPSTKALTLDEAKRHLNILDDSFDTLIGEYIDAAQMMLYKQANVIASPMEFKRFYQGWDTVVFDYEPFTSLIVTYYDSDDDLQTLDASNYKVFSGNFPYVIDFKEMPDLSNRVNPIVVNVVSGYSDAPNDVKQCLRMIVADLFENRQTDEVGSLSTTSRNTDFQISLITRRTSI